MTEQEAIKELERGYLGDTEEIVQAKHMGVKALEEVQQLRKEMWELNQICRDYTSLGTVEEITKIINFLSFDDDTSVLEDLRTLIEYYEIGTVEELKEEKEKQIAKKPLPIITDDNEFICVICPTCQRTAVEVDDLYCRKCGQKLDWGNEDES